MRTKVENKLYMREYRAKKAASRGLPAHVPPASFPDDPAGAVAEWSERVLRVPPGHPLAGSPMKLPSYGVSFLRDVFSHRESLLCMARKNSKSGIVAVYLLARLVGPVRVAGYRAGVVSVSKEKAGELKRQCEEIAVASGLRGLRFLRSPAPGRIEGPMGTVDVLAADRSSGHASGFDDAIIDELGILKERDRDLVNGMRAATSARDGRFVALSIYGDGPFVPEIIERRDDPAVAVHFYRAREGAALDDPKEWDRANPGLAVGIKAVAYMRDEARRVLSTTGGPDQSSFRAMELNLPATPGAELIVTLHDWQSCVHEPEDMPERGGRVWVGFDAGSSASMSAWVALWESGRMEAWAALPSVPDLRTRGKQDGVGSLYLSMQAGGELVTYGGRVTPVAECVRVMADSLSGEEVVAIGFDRYRRAEIVGAMEAEGVRWPVKPRGTGAGTQADGTFDVRSFQKGVLSLSIAIPVSLGMDERGCGIEVEVRRGGQSGARQSQAF